MEKGYVFDFEIGLFLEKCSEIVDAAEKRLNYKFSKKQLEECMKYTIHKARLNDKDDDYIPLLFEDEINFIMRTDQEDNVMSMYEPPEGKKVFTCAYCNEDICDGEDTVELDGEYYHEECVEDNAYELLKDNFGARVFTASTDDIDDGSDYAYECQRDEAMFSA